MLENKVNNTFSLETCLTMQPAQLITKESSLALVSYQTCLNCHIGKRFVLCPQLISMTLLLMKEEMISLASAEYVAVYIRSGARYYIASVSSFVDQLSSPLRKH